MPLPLTSCEIPEETCCPWLFTDATTMLDAISAQLVDCIGEGDECTGPPLATFVSFGPPAFTFTDYLTVWLNSITRTQGSAKLPGFYEIQWTIRLSESGYPTVERGKDDILVNPDPALVQAIAAHAYAHLALLASAVGVAQSAGALLPSACSHVRVSSVVPAVGGGSVLGGCAGAELLVAYTRPA